MYPEFNYNGVINDFMYKKHSKTNVTTVND